MNNILSFSEFSGQELETIVYTNEINEGILGGGIRGFINKRAARKVRAELSEEIEMSKTIMEGIQQGLESLNGDFNVLRKDLEDSNEDSKGEKQKALDAIVKLIEDSRKNTWDLNELIDEGEIDYAGFTANIAVASVAYFGILFTPFRSIVMIHKGYNYFFNIVKNTIRKALVMLQLNFDQFENLIITKGFQSLDYLQDQDTSVKISEFYGKLQAKLFDEKTGMLKGKRGSDYAKQQMQLAKNQIDAMMKADKSRKLSDNAYNCLDQYNNTYTRSLEALRNYTQEDVQKQLDSIKTSMNKLAGQEVDLQTYSELIIAAAEEHAYKVSSSIYSKFAKMTEVFSLPNQKKLIDLIQAATKEQMDNAEKEANEKKEAESAKKLKEESEKLESEGVEVFKKLGGSVGELSDDLKYKDDEINVSGCTYDKYEKLEDEEKDKLDSWLVVHPEVLNKLDDKIQVNINVPFNEICQNYIDSLIDYINPCVVTKTKKIKESTILSFYEYLLEEGMKEKKAEWDEMLNSALEEKDRNMLWDSISTFKDKKTGEQKRKAVSQDVLKYLIDKLERFESDARKDGNKEDEETYSNWIQFLKGKLNDIIKKKEKSGSGSGGKSPKKPQDGEDNKSGEENKQETEGTEPEREKSDDLVRYYLDFSNIDDENQLNYIKELYSDNKEIAIIALGVIGDNVLKDKSFAKNAQSIVNIIGTCLEDENKKVRIKSTLTYNLLTESVKELKDKRSHDYNGAEETKKSDE